MPKEILKLSNQPLTDAIKHVTRDGPDSWKHTGWTDTGSHLYAWDNVNPGKPMTTGMRGIVTDQRGQQSTFTIRHDYDYGAGSVARGGKGYHVNVETKDEKIAFYNPGPNDGRDYAVDAQKMLSERRLNDGDKEAAKWFMKEE